MIARLKGIIEDIGETWVILDVNGVGYQASCSRRTLSNIGQVGEATSLHIETVLRQDSLQLYGFMDQAEHNLFLLLTTVQGVGMRVGLAILSVLTPEQILHAIAAQDKNAITQAEGVGPKLATRVLSELKDKVPQMTMPTAANSSDSSGLRVISTAPSSLTGEAISALVNLGYRRAEAQQAINVAEQQLGGEAGLNELIRIGLSSLGRVG